MAGGVDTVVFDVGNVLIDWERRYLYRKIFTSEGEMERFLAEVASLDWHLEQDRGRTLEAGTEALVLRHPEYAPEIRAFYERWDEMFGGEIPGMAGLLRELRERGYTLHALTNYSAETFPRARERYEFLGWFDETVVSGEEGLVKPGRGIYEVLIRRTGLDPESAVFVDDREANVRAAEDLGFNGVVFRGSEALRVELAGLGVLPPVATGRETGG